MKSSIKCRLEEIQLLNINQKQSKKISNYEKQLSGKNKSKKVIKNIYNYQQNQRANKKTCAKLGKQLQTPDINNILRETNQTKTQVETAAEHLLATNKKKHISKSNFHKILSYLIQPFRKLIQQTQSYQNLQNPSIQMIRQRSFVTNNKENNAVISNIESENLDEKDKSQYSYGKIQGVISTASTNASQGLKSIPASNNNYNNNNAKKSIQTQNSILMEEDYCYESTDSQKGQDANGSYGSNGNNSHNSTNGNSNSKGQTYTSSITAQMLLNDVRALAAQNLKTEQNLRDLQKKINLQKNKRFTQYTQDNKENVYMGPGDKKISRNNSQKDQCNLSQNENYQSNPYTNKNNLSMNNNKILNNNNNNNYQKQQQQQAPVLNQITSNYQNHAQKQQISQNIGSEQNFLQGQNQLNLKNNKIPNQKPQIVEQIKQQNIQQIAPIAAEQLKKVQNNKKIDGLNLSDQQGNKRQILKQKIQQEEQQKREGDNQAQESDQQNADYQYKVDKLYREESFTTRLARLIINENYSFDILNHIIQREPQTVPKNCLQNHDISYQLRAKMVDWMIEVMKSYKCSEETYFMAVRIMDSFLEKCKQKKSPLDIHLIGVTCIFIASKYEEIYPLRIQIIEERISHNKLSQEQIKQTEAEILNTLDFKLLGTSPYEIAMQTLTLIGLQDKLSHEEFQYCHRVCLYLCKMILYDYEYFKSIPYSVSAASIMYIVFKIFNQMIQEFSADVIIQTVIQILQVDKNTLIQSSARILNLAKNFDEYFPDLKNLKKFNGFETTGESNSIQDSKRHKERSESSQNDKQGLNLKQNDKQKLEEISSKAMQVEKQQE
ncbi:amine-terminal domain cyclin (macronuclear) [Tetrahymena thermophila SB210]|uniref:Amine-terminal domain cyclin n=1 Tax=Tetrahymena thermophila (strain SB210) TaxID=312017 RepID=Q22TB9_TETTS|nr:amine-terminal domain cyclin [Tetrahymena thermophila SB210]EAR88519.2 amine-terminal domain cyclin [Tetrahymena thermophila SB210]|eukprot:XP_001008764.2 amine-terminal domain cyclin [Tetrahymena thermophila SB210]